MEYDKVDMKDAKYLVFVDYGYSGSDYHTFVDEESALDYVDRAKSDVYMTAHTVFITPIVEGTELYEE